MSVASSFTRFAKWVAKTAGHPSTFILAVAVILVWAATGPIFHFSDTWQLFINTGTTIITFLMVFLIQNTQNRDGTAVQLKLDEIIRALRGAHNAVLSLEEMSEKELEELKAEYLRLADQARAQLKGKKDSAALVADDQTEIGSSAASGKAHRKASTA
jgi:low affinity Fe/Cu permease